MGGAADKTRPRRRSTRILYRVPLIITIVTDSEDVEWEPVETVTVSKHGAMVRTRHDFKVGDTLEIRIRNKDRSARARVAWISTTNGRQDFDLGFEILGEDGFWEIGFPPDRWTERAPSPREP